jgi:hypothetical protein
MTNRNSIERSLLRLDLGALTAAALMPPGELRFSGWTLTLAAPNR